MNQSQVETNERLELSRLFIDRLGGDERFQEARTDDGMFALLIADARYLGEKLIREELEKSVH